MRKTEKNLLLLYMIFGVSLVIANVVTGKLIDVPITLFGSHIQLPGAAVCYAITFLMTDVIGEIWGKKEANLCVIWGFICQILATLMIIFTQYLPAVDPKMQQAYDSLLGQNWVFVIGSLAGYLVSQSWDVWIFHKIRDEFLAKNPDDKKKRWIWNNLSTMTSQIWDTIIFIGIAFGLGFGWFFNPNMHMVLISMCIGQYLLKFILAAIDTPIFYLLTHDFHKKDKVTK
jgi:uncharacterized integral membrane protein (TIGR00697 family)